LGGPATVPLEKFSVKIEGGRMILSGMSKSH
jgi:hypothetical protein